MHRFFLTALSLIAATFTATASVAQDFKPVLEGYFKDALSALTTDAAISGAIAAQNAKTAGLDQAAVEALDTTWRAEVGTGSTPTITPVITGPAADHLRSVVEASGGRITEIFSMDAKGLNVASSGITSDMWQGDEAKFTDSFGKGAGAVHYSEVELDESTGRYQAQISFTVADPATGQPIGAVTVGVDAESLM